MKRNSTVLTILLVCELAVTAYSAWRTLAASRYASSERARPHASEQDNILTAMPVQDANSVPVVSGKAEEEMRDLIRDLQQIMMYHGGQADA